MAVASARYDRHLVATTPAGDVTPIHEDPDPGILNILIVDDDPHVRALIGGKLRASGHDVVEAESGDAALPLLERGGFEVLVTDISMPGALDGWALADRARSIHPRIPVVYVSGGPQDPDRRLELSLYLRKPFHPDELVAAVRQLAPRRGDEAPA